MMKKLLSVLLIAAMCISTCVCAVNAADVYPESAHDYANNCEQTWTYTYPAQAEALYITFSEETYLEPGETLESVTADDPQEIRRAILEDGYYYEGGDWLYIFDGNGEECCWETGDALSGQTICVNGNSFTITLRTDAQKTAYGFSIDRITTQLPDGFALLRYHTKHDTWCDSLPAGEKICMNYRFKMQQDGDQIIVGWKTPDGREWYYQNVPDRDGGSYIMSGWIETDLTAEPGREYDLYPIWCGIGMTKDEVFAFQNTSRVFDYGYHFGVKQYRHMFTDWIATFALSPMLPITVVVYAYLTLVWPTLAFQGSCCGFPITALLQHYGKIDLLSRQGVGTVRELKPDDELVSTINFYNVMAAVCNPVNHTGIERGTEEYSRQLRALYETLEGGTPVYFEFYPDSRHPLQSIAVGQPLGVFDGAHGILLTGAYTDGDGNHILIAWDNNSSEYPNGWCDVVYINADFTEIYNDNYNWDGDPLDGFSWSDSVKQYESFPADGVSNPFGWHIQLFKNGLSTLRQILPLLSRRNSAR